MSNKEQIAGPEYTFSDSFDVTESITEVFDEHGYIMIRNMFDEEEIGQIKKVLEDSDMAQKYGYGLPDGKGNSAGLVIWGNPGDDVTGIVSRSEKVVNTCQKLLGGDEVYHYHAKFVRKDAFTGGSFLWHQDYGYWYQNGNLFPDLVTVFIAVDDMDQSNGCLQILPGSQKCGRIDHFPVAGQHQCDVERVEQIMERHPKKHVELKSGDAIIFHSNVIHTSAPNNSPKRRWALLFTYNLKSNDPVFKHHHPNYTPLQKVPNAAIKECRNYIDFTGKDFLDPSVDKTVKAEKEQEQ